MTEKVEEPRAAVEQRFAQVAPSPDLETKFPVGPSSAKKLGYDPPEIDALPPSVTESFCGAGNLSAWGKSAPARPCLTWAVGRVWTARSPLVLERQHFELVERKGARPLPAITREVTLT